MASTTEDSIQLFVGSPFLYIQLSRFNFVKNIVVCLKDDIHIYKMFALCSSRSLVTTKYQIM